MEIFPINQYGFRFFLRFAFVFLDSGDFSPYPDFRPALLSRLGGLIAGPWLVGNRRAGTGLRRSDSFSLQGAGRATA